MLNQKLADMLKDQLDHEEHETEVYARKVRETKHSVAKLLYAKLMRDSMQHADVIQCAISYLSTDKWETLAPINETREDILELMDMEEKALRLFTSATSQVRDPHLKTMLTMLALDEEQHYAMLRYLLESFVDKKEVLEV
ncbi:MAG: ferritin-like domain-containing protein [Candidatus Bathyarchaeia archaeon]|jgi:rubrerythrin